MNRTKLWGACALLLLAAGIARADDYDETVSIFQRAGQSSQLFEASYAYAVFPTIGEAGFIVGGAMGKGRLYCRERRPNVRGHRGRAEVLLQTERHRLTGAESRIAGAPWSIANAASDVDLVRRH
jgi:hypothetical protein